MFIIGFSGQKQVGKDTSGNIIIPMLQQAFNQKFIRVGFGDAVKNTLCLFHYKDEKGNLKKVTKKFIEENKENYEYIPTGWNMNIRQSLCNIGDRFREICPEVWIDIALNYNNKNKIITDIRYPNEASIIRNQYNGMVVKVLRPGYDKLEGHRSETSMIEFDKMIPNNHEGVIDFGNDYPYDYIIRNNKGKEELKEKIEQNLVPFILSKWKYFL